jgi:hypothetical protein
MLIQRTSPSSRSANPLVQHADIVEMLPGGYQQSEEFTVAVAAQLVPVALSRFLA